MPRFFAIFTTLYNKLLLLLGNIAMACFCGSAIMGIGKQIDNIWIRNLNHWKQWLILDPCYPRYSYLPQCRVGVSGVQCVGVGLYVIVLSTQAMQAATWAGREPSQAPSVTTRGPTCDNPWLDRCLDAQTGLLSMSPSCCLSCINKHSSANLLPYLLDQVLGQWIHWGS